MKATELRIGNYYIGCSRGEVKTVTSETIKQRESGELSCMKPIPLTEEWLDNLGFSVIPILFFLELVENDCKYVHDIQNLVFELTGRELKILEVLDGNLSPKARKQLQEIIDKGVTPYRISKDSGVAIMTITRILEGKNVTTDQLDKLGTWIKKKKYLRY